MDAHHLPRQPAPQEAREQLAAAEVLLGSSQRDRVVHASGTAVVGFTIAVFMAAQNIVSGGAAIALTIMYFAVYFGQVWWVELAARTVPRRSRLWSRIGIGASLVTGLVVVMPWLNLSAQSEPNTWPMVLAGAALAAVPSLLAAAVIAWPRT